MRLPAVSPALGSGSAEEVRGGMSENRDVYFKGESVQEFYGMLTEFLAAAETMIEFLPNYSESSAGYLRKERLKEAIRKLRGVLA
jgi:hypothetical protein